MSRATPSLYSPLDEYNDEMRVITLRPLRRTGLLQCRLEKVSMMDLSQDFEIFLAQMQQDDRPARKATSYWARLRRPLNSLNAAGPAKNYLPPPGPSRFIWGDFAALSYVWGDDRNRKDIMVNDVVVSVTENLETVLRQLAADGDFEDGFKLWVDALCINQSDEVERASQVSKMRDIYSGSWAVIAWLGLESEWAESRKAFKCLRLIAALKDDERDLAEAVLPEGCFFALHELMKATYWTRLWIVQEVVMGASSTILRCGNEVLHWDIFCRAISVLYHGENWSFKDFMLARDLRRKHIYGDNRWQTTSVHLVHKDLRELSRFEDQGGSRIGFRRLLEIASSTGCRDVRDKVYGLVGVMDELVAKEVSQAYSLGVPKLFAAVTKAFIVRHTNLEPLRQANPWGRRGAPTWAADWTWDGRMRWTRPESNFTSPLWDPSEVEIDPAAIYNAHSGVPAHFEFLENDTLLRCEGFVLDKISGLGAPEDGYFDWAEERIVQCPTWKSAYGTEVETKKALLRALMGGRVAHGGRLEERHLALSSLPSNFEIGLPQFQRRGWKWFTTQDAYYFKWECWRKAHNHFMLGEKRLDHYFTNQLSNETDEATYIEVYNSADRMVQERRFMLTENGYLGWAPDNAYERIRRLVENQARVGDLIVIIFGCSTPLVVRPREDRYEVVGEAYVEGFMDGEASQLLENGKRQVESFSFI